MRCAAKQKSSELHVEGKDDYFYFILFYFLLFLIFLWNAIYDDQWGTGRLDYTTVVDYTGYDDEDLIFNCGVIKLFG